VVAEGARDKQGNPITSEHVRRVLAERLGEDVRVTILGHIQRGGSPSAFNRWMSTLIGHAAVELLLSATPESEPQVIGMRYNRVNRVPLMESVRQTQAVAAAIAARDYDRAMELRGGSFKDTVGKPAILAAGGAYVPESPFPLADARRHGGRMPTAPA